MVLWCYAAIRLLKVTEDVFCRESRVVSIVRPKSNQRDGLWVFVPLLSLSFSSSSIAMHDPWMPPELQAPPLIIHANHTYTRKFCGCMSLRGGSALACTLWLAIHLYVCVLSFQQKSPIFSYLDKNATIILAVICLVFSFAALMGLFSLFVNKPALLQHSHRLIWWIVIVFLIDMLVNSILFGIQWSQFNAWCVDRSRSRTDEEISATFANGTSIQLTLTPSLMGSDLYNCNRLWQDELKFSIAIYIMLMICYTYWALCMWSYTQKQKIVLHYELQRHATRAGAGAGIGIRGPEAMMNLKPSAVNPADPVQEDRQRSLAQIARSFFDSIEDSVQPPKEVHSNA
ncbi:hypothetical protein BDF14DRAFT_1816599 [Spinellus fusiger]|nr:hypothetical protein BDF14DRAFT_1816599 [Spinellus fusiger]